MIAMTLGDVVKFKTDDLGPRERAYCAVDSQLYHDGVCWRREWQMASFFGDVSIWVQETSFYMFEMINDSWNSCLHERETFIGIGGAGYKACVDCDQRLS